MIDLLSVCKHELSVHRFRIPKFKINTRLGFFGLRVTGYELRAANYGLRAKRAYRRIRNSECGMWKKRIWNAEVGKRKRPWSQVTSLLKNQSFKLYLIYPVPHALCFIIPNSALPLPWPRPTERRSYFTPH